MIPEQALVLRSEKGATVITGCAHNGIVDILASVREKMPEPIYLVLGGFHTLDLPPSVVRLMIKRFREMDVARVAPTHCTGTEAIQLFREAYGSDFVEAVVGTNLEV
jgi:7,8-dihydropterin-6-yl-methyl-4-(beta-D-ribofuranosyl)aminobenzene 5'-phosphate synthase